MDTVPLFQVALSGFLGSSLAAALLGALVLRRTRTVEAEVKAHFDEKFNVFLSTRVWQQQALAELFGPLVMHFERTKTAFDRWNGRNLFLEAQIVRQGNQTIRDILLTKGHLVPPNLIEHATRLVVHYDVWMEEFDRVRNANSPSADAPFIFAGPSGYPFPRESETMFKEEFYRLQRALYGVR